MSRETAPAIEVPVVRLAPDLPLPRYETVGAAGMDLRCRGPVVLPRFQPRAVPTGLRIAVPAGLEAQVRPRSGLALERGVTCVNSPGTIDADYRGELAVLLINIGPKDVVELPAGSRIAQLVFSPVLRARWRPVDSLDSTERGRGGLGSTGLS